jgi:hypothetical protein
MVGLVTYVLATTCASLYYESYIIEHFSINITCVKLNIEKEILPNNNRHLDAMHVWCLSSETFVSE